MTHLIPESSLFPPPWPHCGHGAVPGADPVGCRGVHVPGQTACLAHLADTDRDAYLASLAPGANVDHRGTSFTGELLHRLLDALRAPATGHPCLGYAWFKAATFQDDAMFRQATFQHDAWFEGAAFQGDARFEMVTFQGIAQFEMGTFQGDAWFGRATFQGDARFRRATFQDTAMFEMTNFQNNAQFEEATFQGTAWFRSATFQGTTGFEVATFQNNAQFEEATFQSDVWFEQATFERLASFGPFVCAGQMGLSGAVFGGPVSLSLAARRLECRRTRWSSTAELRLRYATVDFSHAVFEYPLTIAAETAPFVLSHGEPVEEQALADAPDTRVRLASLRGVDAAHLVLVDIDLSECLFTGTVHLDQLRLEGACSFDGVPLGTHWRRRRPLRFTPRRTLAEEHHWRARRPGAVRGWNTAVLGAGPVGPAQLAPVYRALRKAFEDGKNEPDAADFYYGEMGAA